MTFLGRPLLIVTLASSLVGCGAGRGIYYVWGAEKAFHEAEQRGAEKNAVYEYVLAREYLQKAKEEIGYSDYRAAEQLAAKALLWSNKAAEVAEYGTTERELMLQEAIQNAPDQSAPFERKDVAPYQPPAPDEE
jgi:hypothetical protein